MPGASLRARAAALADRLSKERSRHRRLIITIQVVLGVAGFGYILYGLIRAVHDGTTASSGSLVAAIAVLVPLRLLALSATSFRWRAWLMLGGSGDVTMKWALYVNAVANFFGAITFGPRGTPIALGPLWPAAKPFSAPSRRRCSTACPGLPHKVCLPRHWCWHSPPAWPHYRSRFVLYSLAQFGGCLSDSHPAGIRRVMAASSASSDRCGHSFVWLGDGPLPEL